MTDLIARLLDNAERLDGAGSLISAANLREAASHIQSLEEENKRLRDLLGSALVALAGLDRDSFIDKINDALSHTVVGEGSGQ